ncbi:MAG: peptidylprolyl isomerase [Candidatus Limnocylindrales bacterium]
MPKQKRTIPQRSHVTQTGVRPGFSRRVEPSSSKSGIPTTWLALGAVGVVAVLVVAAYALGFFNARPGGAGASQTPTATIGSGSFSPSDATPLANPPAEPASDGTRAIINVPDGRIVIELFTDSAPVASANFIKLAEAGFYNGVKFHRLVPEFVIQGGDPLGTGTGGPGYTIQDEPVVGQYGRGIVAMARTSAPNSQGSQFFVVLSDAARPALEQFRTYVIFGRVVEGMDVVDKIAALPNSGSPNNAATVDYRMSSVTIERP